MTEARGRRKVRVGRVVSDKMDKTVVVAIERRVHHRLYGRSLRRVTKFKAHDEQNAYHVGDLVRIVETRPLSHTKRWRVQEMVSQGQIAEVSPSEAIEETVQEVLALPSVGTEEEVSSTATAGVVQATESVQEAVPPETQEDVPVGEAADGQEASLEETPAEDTSAVAKADAGSATGLEETSTGAREATPATDATEGEGPEPNGPEEVKEK